MSFSQAEIDSLNNAAEFLEQKGLLLSGIKPIFRLGPDGSVDPMIAFELHLKENGIDRESFKRMSLEDSFLADLQNIMKRTEPS